jgi:hypothetical protein
LAAPVLAMSVFLYVYTVEVLWLPLIYFPTIHLLNFRTYFFHHSQVLAFVFFPRIFTSYRFQSEKNYCLYFSKHCLILTNNFLIIISDPNSEH